MNLFSAKRGFFGRTYVGRRVELDDTTWKPKADEASEWALMWTKIKDDSVCAIIEVSLIINRIRRETTEVPSNEEEKNPTSEASEEKKDEFSLKPVTTTVETVSSQLAARIQIGMAEIPLNGGKPTVAVAELFQGSPRLLLQGKKIRDFPKVTATLSFTLTDAPIAYQRLQSLIPSECFISNSDTIPGLKISKLPQQISDFKPEDLCETRKLYLQDFSFRNLEAFDKAVEGFIK